MSARHKPDEMPERSQRAEFGIRGIASCWNGDGHADIDLDGAGKADLRNPKRQIEYVGTRLLR